MGVKRTQGRVDMGKWRPGTQWIRKRLSLPIRRSKCYCEFVNHAVLAVDRVILHTRLFMIASLRKSDLGSNWAELSR